jgi:ABC-type multidrug transport system fused ATPase/permease subunit
MKSIWLIWDLMTRQQQRAAVALLLLMIVGMVLETLGVGLIIPALALMTHVDFARRYPAAAPLLRVLGNPDRGQLVMWGMLALVVVYGMKAAFLAFLYWRQTRFVGEVQVDLSRRLFTTYLRQSYSFHLLRNSAELINNVVGEVTQVSHTCLMAALNLLTELLIVLGITVLLVVVTPVGALVVGAVFGLPSWLYHRLTDGRLMHWGDARQRHERLRMQHLQQGLGGVKELLLLGREGDCLAQYERHDIGCARAISHHQLLQQLPRLGLELLAVCALAGLVVVMLAGQHSIESLLPVLGLFAAAAFRLLPSANRVINAVQSIRYALPAIRVVHAEVALSGPAGPVVGIAPSQVRFHDVLTLERVSFRYPETAAGTLHEIEMRIPHGSCVGLIGGSGAGKSTLVDIILGLQPPTSGAVCADGADIRQNLRGWQSLLGYVPQSIFLTDDTLRRNVAFGLTDEEIDDEAVRRAVSAAQLEDFIATLPAGLETMVGERGVRLSGGQLQRVGIARALYHDPQVLVLDEATSALDTTTERGVMAAVRALRGHKTLIIVAHRFSTVENCDWLYRLEAGRIIEVGEPLQVLATATPLKAPA